MQENSKQIQRAFFLAGVFFLAPSFIFAYTSPIVRPVDQSEVLKLSNPEVSQEFFGKLEGFPHTFEFTIAEKLPFKAVVSVPDESTQKNDISIILVKNQRRGVAEIERTRINDQSWDVVYNSMLAESFKNGGFLEGSLEPGTYKLEVSSPDNEGIFHLVWGTTEVKRGYFAKLRVLFEVKRILEHSQFGALLSPLMYLPLLAVCIVSFVFYKKRKKINNVDI